MNPLGLPALRESKPINVALQHRGELDYRKHIPLLSALQIVLQNGGYPYLDLTFQSL